MVNRNKKLRTDFKRKLDLTVVAIPPIAGKSLPLLCNRKPAYTALAQWPQGQIRLNSVRNPWSKNVPITPRNPMKKSNEKIQRRNPMKNRISHRKNEFCGRFK